MTERDAEPYPDPWGPGGKFIDDGSGLRPVVEDEDDPADD